MTFWVAGAGLVGAAVSASAAGDAADTQLQGTREATAAQTRQFNKQIELQEPWRQAGIAGLNKLLYGAGIVPTGQMASGGTLTAASLAPGAAPDQVSQAYRDLLGRDPDQRGLEYYKNMLANGTPIEAIRNEIAGSQEAQQPHGAYVMAPAAAAAAATAAAAPPPASPGADFGSLLRPFGASDFTADPGYAFVQQQGEQGLARAAQAGRGVGSGKYLKDAMRFNTGLGSQEYSKVYDRYRNNQSDIWNRLASVAGIGQTATNQQTAAAGAYGSNVASNILGGANAQAAGQVGSANAWNQGIGQGVSFYGQNRMMERMYPAGGYGGGYGGGVTPPNPYYGQTAQQPMMDWYS